MTLKRKIKTLFDRFSPYSFLNVLYIPTTNSKKELQFSNILNDKIVRSLLITNFAVAVAADVVAIVFAIVAYAWVWLLDGLSHLENRIMKRKRERERHCVCLKEWHHYILYMSQKRPFPVSMCAKTKAYISFKPKISCI